MVGIPLAYKIVHYFLQNQPIVKMVTCVWLMVHRVFRDDWKFAGTRFGEESVVQVLIKMMLMLYAESSHLEYQVNYTHCIIMTLLISTLTDPYIYTDSHFGDGNGIILYSNFQCTGYEGSLIDCPKQQYGTFNCPRNAVVGIVCRDG